MPIAGVAVCVALAALLVLLGWWRAAAVVTLGLVGGGLAVGLDGRWWVGRVSGHVLDTRRELRAMMASVARANERLGELVTETHLLSAATRRAAADLHVLERRLLAVYESDRLRSMDNNSAVRSALDSLESTMRVVLEAISSANKEVLENVTASSARMGVTERRLLGTLESQRLAQADWFGATGRFLEVSQRGIQDISERQFEIASAVALSREQLSQHFTSLEARQAASRNEVIQAVAVASDICTELKRLVDEQERTLSSGFDQIRYELGGAPEAVGELTQALGSSFDALRSHIDDRGVAHDRGLESIRAELRSLSAEVSERLDDLTEAPLGEGESKSIQDPGVRAVNSAVRKLTAVARDETQQVEALLQLQRHIDPIAPLPPSGRWAMDARSLLHLCHVVEQFRPRRVVELGGGTSTVWLGYLVAKYGGSLVSIDHDPKFADLTAASVRRHGLDSVVETRWAPLTPVVLEDGTHEWYAQEAFEDLERIDLLVVDGPPGNSGARARYPALPMLHERLAPDSVVILDDSQRPDEQDALQSWRDVYPQFEIRDEGVSRLCVLRRFGC